MLNNLIKQAHTSYTIIDTESFKCIVMPDGQEQYADSCFAPGVSREEVNYVRRNVPGDFMLAYNILVIVSGKKVVLIDAGNGEQAMPEAGLLPHHLLAANINPDSVTDIVISHAHTDHINGLLDSEQRPVFPNATIHIAKAEFEFWQSENINRQIKNNYIHDLSALQKNAIDKFAALRERISLYESDQLLFGFLLPIAAPGHTPGHHIFEIITPQGSFLHIADICHDDLLLFAKPAWGTVFDVDFELAANTRTSVLHKLADTTQLAFGYHMPWPGLGRVVRDGEAFAWKQEKHEVQSIK